MNNIDSLLQRARAMLNDYGSQSTLPNASYKFELTGEQPLSFVLDLRDPPAMHVDDRCADVTFKLSAPDFIEMAENRIDSRELFFGGRLRVDGDMGLALKLKRFRNEVDKPAAAS
jgi:predicted lipid carrier protein YhbT